MLGLDIGGANLKAATSAGRAISVPFALWKNPDGLADALGRLVAEFPAERDLAVTMTGELCDCYESKADGVLAILAAVARISSERGLVEPRIWTNTGRFVTLGEAIADPLPAAAANWLALATYAGRLAPIGSAILIDIGSTTTDIVGLVDGVPVPMGRTDRTRLESGELVYCGVRRTPLCALFGLEKAAEFFATTEDVYLTLSELPEEPHRTDTADGRPATRAHALRRLARMECADVGDGLLSRRLAEWARRRQTSSLSQCLGCVARSLPSPVTSIIGAGSGRFLIPSVMAGWWDFGQLPLVTIDESISAAACAYAVTVLAEEMR